MADLRYTKLKAEELLPAYNGMTDVQKVASINASRSVNIDVQWADVRDVFMSNGDWGTLTYTSMLTSGTFIGGGTFALATRVMAIDIRECCLYGGILRTSDATIRTRVSSRASTLAGATVGAISAASMTAIGALISTTRSRAVEIDWPNGVTVEDLITARAAG